MLLTFIKGHHISCDSIWHFRDGPIYSTRFSNIITLSGYLRVKRYILMQKCTLFVQRCMKGNISEYIKVWHPITVWRPQKTARIVLISCYYPNHKKVIKIFISFIVRWQCTFLKNFKFDKNLKKSWNFPCSYSVSGWQFCTRNKLQNFNIKIIKIFCFSFFTFVWL